MFKQSIALAAEVLCTPILKAAQKRLRLNSDVSLFQRRRCTKSRSTIAKCQGLSRSRVSPTCL